jgi:hypothetical protein
MEDTNSAKIEGYYTSHLRYQIVKSAIITVKPYIGYAAVWL